jgi:hypothetical protein
MKLNVEEILMVIIAFIIGWFLSNMIKTSRLIEGKIGDGCTEDNECGSSERCSGDKKCVGTNWNVGDMTGNSDMAFR